MNAITFLLVVYVEFTHHEKTKIEVLNIIDFLCNCLLSRAQHGVALSTSDLQYHCNINRYFQGMKMNSKVKTTNSSTDQKLEKMIQRCCDTYLLHLLLIFRRRMVPSLRYGSMAFAKLQFLHTKVTKGINGLSTRYNRIRGVIPNN